MPVALPDLPAQIARDVAALRQDPGPATTRTPSGELRTEIELQPADLGRLRMVIQSGERGLLLQVAVERPESLDAVRRHLDGLQRHLAGDGVSLDRLDLSSGGSAWARGGEGEANRARPATDLTPDAAGPSEEAAPQATPPPPQVGGAGRLDIRV